MTTGEIIEQTGLGEVRGKMVGNLSHGFRKRVGLAQALIHDPEVLILDEGDRVRARFGVPYGAVLFVNDQQSELIENDIF